MHQTPLYKSTLENSNDARIFEEWRSIEEAVFKSAAIESLADPATNFFWGGQPTFFDLPTAN